MHKIILFIVLITVITACKSNKTFQQKEILTESKTNTDAENNYKKQNTQARDANLMEMGYDFVAFGNEPLWILKLDFDKNIAEFEMIEEPSRQLIITNNTSNLIEEIKLESKTYSLDISAQQKACYNSMSGEGFTYTIKLMANSKALQGCGKYLSENNVTGEIDANIFNTWKLHKFSGTIYTSSNITLTIMPENRYFGYSSCNNYSGTYSIEKNNIKFGPTIMTKKFCPGNLEHDYMQALNQARTYFIDGYVLVFLDEDQNELVRFNR